MKKSRFAGWLTWKTPDIALFLLCLWVMLGPRVWAQNTLEFENLWFGINSEIQVYSMWDGRCQFMIMIRRNETKRILSAGLEAIYTVIDQKKGETYSRIWLFFGIINNTTLAMKVWANSKSIYFNNQYQAVQNLIIQFPSQAKPPLHFIALLPTQSQQNLHPPKTHNLPPHPPPLSLTKTSLPQPLSSNIPNLPPPQKRIPTAKNRFSNNSAQKRLKMPENLRFCVHASR